jgi:GNAT superfamily N-acetyltransferase
MRIERLRNATKKDTNDINALLPAQADRPRFLKLNELKRILNQSCIETYVVRTKIGGNNAIVGMASVIFYYVPTGLIAFIEELTVYEAYRGHKLGIRLVEKLIGRAKARKAKHISTYTNPKRLAANAVYQKLGFFHKETNFYRINLILPKPSVKKEIERVQAYAVNRRK